MILTMISDPHAFPYITITLIPSVIHKGTLPLEPTKQLTRPLEGSHQCTLLATVDLTLCEQRAIEQTAPHPE